LSFGLWSFTIKNHFVFNFNKGKIMGYGRKSQAKKMLQRKGQAKKKAKLKEKIQASKGLKKR